MLKKPLSLFVDNRVREIWESTDVSLVLTYHCNKNLIDFPTKGLSVDEISKCDVWWHGPAWLRNPGDWLNGLYLRLTLKLKVLI